MGKQKNNNLMVFVWIAIGLAIVLVIFLIVGTISEKKQKEPQPSPVPSATPIGSPSPASANKELPPKDSPPAELRPVEPRLVCQKLVQRSVMGAEELSKEILLGWLPHPNERLLLSWSEAKRVFRLYLLSVSSQGASFTLHREYPLYCSEKSGPHCLSANPELLSMVKMQPDSFLGASGGVLSLNLKDNPLAIPYDFSKLEGPSFYPFLKGCVQAPSVNRWVSLGQSNAGFHLGWSQGIRGGWVYLVPRERAQALALNFSGDSSTFVYAIGPSGLIPSDCKGPSGDMAILDADLRGDRVVFLIEDKAKVRQVIDLKLQSDRLQLITKWSGAQLSGNPGRVAILQDGSLLVRVSDWLGQRFGYRRITGLGKDQLIQVVLNDEAQQSHTSIDLHPWGQGLSELRDKTSVITNEEDLAAMKQDEVTNQWQPFLIRQSRDKNSLIGLEFAAPQWTTTPSAKSLFWERLTPRTYFILDTKTGANSPLATWVLCPEEAKN